MHKREISLMSIDNHWYSGVNVEGKNMERMGKTILILLNGEDGMRAVPVVSSMHVRSHRGDPWNELADVVCGTVSLRGTRLG